MLRYLYNLLFGSNTLQHQYHEPSYQPESFNPYEQRRITNLNDVKAYNYDHQPIYVGSKIERCRYLIQWLKRKLNARQENVLAIDCEWNSSGYGRERVALLQLATLNNSQSGGCILIRLCKLNKDDIYRELKEIMEDSDIVKIGVAPFTDAKFLRDDYGVHVRSTLDLRYMAHAAGLPPGGLAKMSEDYLGVSLDKSSKFSDWEAEMLSETQIKYAAADVVNAIRLFKYFARYIERCKEHMYVTLLTTSLQRADHMADIPDLRNCTCHKPIDVEHIINKYCLEYVDKNYGPPKSL
ncbi:exonuclease 3'-5' domain-containing protein 2-like [Sitodiplosis mosellana]|uniref:exonuclease 3'-5' domain-containing protein 2-like n=1 Tax=Sitodiplosis mosellana TaxID=263140 RepID=UPI002444BFF3|nr:exonuclease 3'-5' domain-containing protein 2-like [Sitodiplosis mosellana]